MEPSKSSGPSQGDSTGREVYTPGYGGPTNQVMVRRTAAGAASFLLPHLRSGIRLLDCGCGPGSITIGLAEAVAPGEVVGIDLEPTMAIAENRALVLRGSGASEQLAPLKRQVAQ